MPYHLMNLRSVPDDEADEIRALFEAHEIRYYETPPSRWGISMGGFWVHDSVEAARARELLEVYQFERVGRQREAYEKARASGQVPGFWLRLRRKPLSVVFVLLAAAFILMLTLAPFLGL